MTRFTRLHRLAAVGRLVAWGTCQQRRRWWKKGKHFHLERVIQQHAGLGSIALRRASELGWTGVYCAQVCSVLCTTYCAPCTVYCVLYCVLCTVYCVLCNVYCVQCTVNCALRVGRCVLCAALFAVQRKLCAMYLGVCTVSVCSNMLILVP